jgi:hypothetical protein
MVASSTAQRFIRLISQSVHPSLPRHIRARRPGHALVLCCQSGMDVVAHYAILGLAAEWGILAVFATL